MATRQKKKLITEVSRETAEDAFAAYNKCYAQLEQLQGQMNNEITKVKEKYDERITRLQEQKDEYFELIQVYAESNPGLFEKKKSIDTVHGTMGFRTGTPKLKTLKGFTWEAVKTLVKKLMPAYIRTEETVAKDLLLADREKDQVKLQLPAVGIEVVQDETFYLQPALESYVDV